MVFLAKRDLLESKPSHNQGGQAFLKLGWGLGFWDGSSIELDI
jgi:nitrogen fixation protein